jgi:hypothetical protein
MLSNLFVAQTIAAVQEALGSATVDGTVVVVGQPRLARGLAEYRQSVVTIADRSRPLRRSPHPVCAVAAQMPLGDGLVAALVGAGVGERDDWVTVLAEWSRAVCDGGALVLVDRQVPSEVGRRALCGGLAEIQQRQAGRTVVTSGLVTRL